MSDNGILAAIAALRTEMQGSAATMRGEMGALRGEMMALHGEALSHIAALRGELVGKLERVDDQLTTIRDDMLVSARLASTAIDRSSASREEVQNLTSMVSTMHQSMLSMQTRLGELEKKGSAA